MLAPGDAPESLRLYHGTSSAHLDGVRAGGLRDPYLTDDRELAHYYAEASCEEGAGEAVILLVPCSPLLLSPDLPSLSEPVVVGERMRTRALQARESGVTVSEHLDLLTEEALRDAGEDDLRLLSGTVSLQLTGACRYRGVVQPEVILELSP